MVAVVVTLWPGEIENSVLLRGPRQRGLRNEASRSAMKQVNENSCQRAGHSCSEPQTVELVLVDVVLLVVEVSGEERNGPSSVISAAKGNLADPCKVSTKTS